MIGSQTYLDREGFYVDLLAAYSALDHHTTTEMSAYALAWAARRTLCRLAALMALHGDDVPSHFLADVVEAERQDSDVAAIAAAYLEAGGARSHLDRDKWELQQELVHFSRIVDVDVLDLDDSAAERALARLRGSHRLPEPLKVLSELMIVTRSRLAQRGERVELPRLRKYVSTGLQLDDDTTVAVAPGGDYVLVAAAPRRRTHRQMGFMFTALLDYLTPVEAAVALWAGAAGEGRSRPAALLLISAESNGRNRYVHWAHEGRLVPEGTTPASWCWANLPAIGELDGARDTIALTGSLACIRYSLHADSIDVRVGTSVWAKTATLHRPGAHDGGERGQMSAEAADLLRRYTGPDILSIECGHIHLDRALDVDQEIGADLGAAAIDVLRSRQDARPVVVPMMDDDHVLVRLTPTSYRGFMERRLPNQPMTFVPESSPIVRSVVCSLWSRLHADHRDGQCRERGGNVFFRLPTGTQCELFEDYDGDAASGCVLFECALLVYRSAVDAFDTYFQCRFDLQMGVHDRACGLLSIDEPHDRKVARLQDFYETFAAVTDPRRPDPGVVALVDSVLGQPVVPLAHLNVLEDYYEVQQDKVRALLNALGLPIRLLTLSFSAQTGRVSLLG